MRYGFLVPLLVAMLGAEAVAQVRASAAADRTPAVAVAAAAIVQEQPAYAASFVSQSVPSSVTLQTPAPVVVTMQNTGTATWFKADGDVFLATQEPQDNYYWCIQDNRYGSHSGNRVLLPNDVAPGQQVTFNFVVKPLSCFFAAPSPLRFRMLSQLHGTFGDETPDPAVGVTDAAEFVSQQVPAIMDAGASVAVSVTFKNTTSTTWTSAGGYSLIPAGPLGNTIWGISAVALPGPVAPGESATFTFSVVAPATLATYNFQWQMNLQPSGPFGQVSPATAVQVITPGPPNFGGLWWNAPAGSESGWGINLAHQGNVIFATWFTYDLTGKGWWLTMLATITAATNTYSGTLLKAVGPAFDAVPFDPTQVTQTAVGTGTLTFTNTNTGTFAYTVNGVSQIKTITHQVFGPLPTCRFGLTNPALGTNYQDLWWNAPPGSESGWGLNLTQQGATIFATWFTYDHDHTPMWLAATMINTALGTYSGALYRTTGPAFNAVPFDPASVVVTSVGIATLVFADGNDASFSYTVNGVSQTKAITREVLVAPGTVCQ